MQPAVTDVLLPKPDNIGSPLRGVEQERKGKPGLGADRVFRLELLDFLDRPGVEASGLARIKPPFPSDRHGA